MAERKIVSKAEWVAQRKELLAKEKELTRARDQLTKERQALPWVKIDKPYLFDSSDRVESLADLFDGKSQLIIYHFMFQPDWTEGCKSCSLLTEHFAPTMIHLNQRDVSMALVSRAAIEKIDAFKERMGWNVKWVSSQDSDFNADFDVYFPGPAGESEAYYNYEKLTSFPSTELPGLSVFFKDEDGNIFHTYSCFARGLEQFMSVYNLLDTVPLGRNEEGLAYGMEWVRHRDKYGDESVKDVYVELLSAGSESK